MGKEEAQALLRDDDNAIPRLSRGRRAVVILCVSCVAAITIILLAITGSRIIHIILANMDNPRLRRRLNKQHPEIVIDDDDDDKCFPRQCPDEADEDDIVIERKRRRRRESAAVVFFCLLIVLFGMFLSERLSERTIARRTREHGNARFELLSAFDDTDTAEFDQLEQENEREQGSSGAAVDASDRSIAQHTADVTGE